MKKFVVVLILLSCLLVGFIMGILTKSNIDNTENHHISNSISFDEAFNGLDYTNHLLSNVDKYEIIDAKSDMMRAHNLYIIHNMINIADEENRLSWRSEKIVWDQLSNDIIQFIDAKMTEQWETGKTGTAGGSYCARCRYDLETMRAILLETIVIGPDFVIKDNGILSNFPQATIQIPSDYTIHDLLNEIAQYLDVYISKEFIEWRNESTSLSQWRNSTSLLIMSLKNHLNEYIETSNDAFGSTCPNHTDILLKWLLEQIAQIIKIGD